MIMRTLENLATPCILIDEERMESNLRRMASRATSVQLRPHTKTHKSVALANRQLKHGANGITVAKVSEAEKFIQHGFQDVRIAYPVVGESQLEQLIKLAQQARISFCIDSQEGADRASKAFSNAGISVDVLLEIDTGHGRCGIAYDREDVLALALKIQKLDRLNLCGILTHEGHAYSGNHAEITQIMSQTRDRMLEIAVRLHEAHCIDPSSFEISMGSTPSAHVFENTQFGDFQITELRPGNYIFNDLTQVELGICSLDACALTVLSTVVSQHRTSQGTERFVLDAGRKVLTSDTLQGRSDYGCILYNPQVRAIHPHAKITGLSEEHGWGEVLGGSTLQIGDRVQIVPNHACVVVNMVDRMFLVGKEANISEITVDARGCVL